MQHKARKGPLLTREDRRKCHESIRAGSKSFHAASVFLPKDVRLAARALYAFCRSSDDLVDEDNPDGTASKRLHQRLDLIYAGAPIDLVCDRAFAAVVHHHNIPRDIPDALIEGFEWDEAGRHYESMDDLLAYGARVASTVGVMMTVIMGVRERSVLARAADLGLAMQLTNIARDVGEDARNGRVYLPEDMLRAQGLSSAALIADPVYSPALGHVVHQLLQQAGVFYKRSLTGVSGLPFNCRPAIRGAGLVYKAIGREIEINGYDSVNARAHTSTARKLQLMTMATLTPISITPVSTAPAHSSVAFLINAAATAKPAARSVDDKFGRMLELMANSRERQRNAIREPMENAMRGDGV